MDDLIDFLGALVCFASPFIGLIVAKLIGG